MEDDEAAPAPPPPPPSQPPQVTLDKDTSLLSKVAINHLFLSQFEAFRATLLSLCHRNPNLALSILLNIISHGGHFDHLIFSTNCSSPAFLTWLSSLHLFKFHQDASSLCSFPSLRLRVELLLYLHIVISREVNVIKLLDEIMEVGLRRLKEVLLVSENIQFGIGRFKEEGLWCLREVILPNADVFASLCDNIQGQVGVDDNDMAIDQRALKSIQKYVQLAHLDGMRECVNKEDINGPFSQIRYLHLAYGVTEEEYRVVFQDLLQKVSSREDGSGDASLATRNKLLSIHQETLLSNCTPLVQLLQVVQDQLLLEEVKMLRASENLILPPLKKLQDCMRKDQKNKNKDTLNLDFTACIRDLYHYARVAGLHILECIMETALSSVKNEQLDEASYVVSLFPRLQPLVGVLGWDLLSGKTTARRKLMQLLWTGQSKIRQLDESSLYENVSDEVLVLNQQCFHLQGPC